MKFANALTTAVLLACSAPAFGDTADKTLDPVALAQAREIVDTILPPDKRSDQLATMMRAIADQMRGSIAIPASDEGLRQIMDNYLAKTLDRIRPITDRFLPKQSEAMAEAYVREFSSDELAQIGQFAKTPAGRHYLSRSTAMVSDPAVAAANRVYFMEAQQEARAGVAELQQTVFDYIAKHPEITKKMVKQYQADAPQR